MVLRRKMWTWRDKSCESGICGRVGEAGEGSGSSEGGEGGEGTEFGGWGRTGGGGRKGGTILQQEDSGLGYCVGGVCEVEQKCVSGRMCSQVQHCGWCTVVEGRVGQAKRLRDQGIQGTDGGRRRMCEKGQQ